MESQRPYLQYVITTKIIQDKTEALRKYHISNLQYIFHLKNMK